LDSLRGVRPGDLDSWAGVNWLEVCLDPGWDAADGKGGREVVPAHLLEGVLAETQRECLVDADLVVLGPAGLVRVDVDAG